MFNRQKDATLQRVHRLVRHLHNEGSAFAWQYADYRTSLLCLPAIGLALAIPLAMGRPGTAVLAGAGAVSVGFGAFQQPLFFRGAPMLIAAIGIAISTLVGSAVGVSLPLLLVVAALWAFLYGLSDALHAATSYVGLQCAIFLVIAAAQPQPLSESLLRGGGVLLGGMLEYLVIMLLWLITPLAPVPATQPADPHTTAFKLSAILRHTFAQNNIKLRFAIRLAVTALIAEIVASHLHFRNSYWVPMTALIILKPQFKDTTNRALTRTLGTLGGGMVATGLTVLLKPHVAVLVILVLICVWASYVLLNVNYAAYSVVLTGYIAFVMAINRMPEQQTIVRRIIATSLGGAVGFAVHLATLWLKPPPTSLPPPSGHADNASG